MVTLRFQVHICFSCQSMSALIEKGVWIWVTSIKAPLSKEGIGEILNSAFRFSSPYCVSAQDQIKSLTAVVAVNKDAIYLGIACFQ